MIRVHGAFTPAHDPATTEAPEEQVELNAAIRSALGRGQVDADDGKVTPMNARIKGALSARTWTVIESGTGGAA